MPEINPFWQVGELYMKEKEYQRAYQLFKKSSRTFSSYQNYILGKLFYEMEKYYQALRSFIKVMRNDLNAKRVQESILMAGECYLKLNKPKIAARYFMALKENFKDQEIGKRASERLKVLNTK